MQKYSFCFCLHFMILNSIFLSRRLHTFWCESGEKIETEILTFIHSPYQVDRQPCWTCQQLNLPWASLTGCLHYLLLGETEPGIYDLWAWVLVNGMWVGYLVNHQLPIYGLVKTTNPSELLTSGAASMCPLQKGRPGAQPQHLRPLPALPEPLKCPHQ